VPGHGGSGVQWLRIGSQLEQHCAGDARGDAPEHDARLKPSWLLAGPGRNWQSASSCANWLSPTQLRRSTSSRR
jgi:hypothetical protein